MKLKIFLDELELLGKGFGDCGVCFYIVIEEHFSYNFINNATVKYYNESNLITICFDNSIFYNSKYSINSFINQIKWFKNINDESKILFNYYDKKLVLRDIVFKSLPGYGYNSFNFKTFAINFDVIG